MCLRTSVITNGSNKNAAKHVKLIFGANFATNLHIIIVPIYLPNNPVKQVSLREREWERETATKLFGLNGTEAGLPQSLVYHSNHYTKLAVEEAFPTVFHRREDAFSKKVLYLLEKRILNVSKSA